ncbi:MAG: hypothetical protein EU981_00935 [Candidatus Liberibacter ctenarytainae]|uniref:Pilus assembly protein CpaD n=1 Tax=Candidatus Liberibacter ctenarytainae TaxID=2020335 RepID=A0A937ARD7_9HYPH|nr:hypothetical protein [Candidatus Liberibacter ctenarytainae]
MPILVIECLRNISWKMFFLQLLVLVPMSFSLSSCGSVQQNNMLSSSGDYHKRYPITMKKVEYSVDLSLLSGRGSYIPPSMRETIHGFIDKYRSNSVSVLFIMVPSPTVSSAAIREGVKSIRRIIISRGVSEKSLSERVYDANHGLDIDTIRLSYFASRPYVGRCGLWPKSIIGSFGDNYNWYNYGCAYQHNLAAQVSNPSDLFGPRAMTPPDVVQRDKSIAQYRDSGQSQGGKSSYLAGPK